MKRKLMILGALAIMVVNFSSCVVHERTYAYRDRGYNRYHHGWHHHRDAGTTVIVR